MEHSNILESLNSSALKLLAAQSLDELCAEIVEEAKKMAEVEQAEIFLQEKDKLEPVYLTSSKLSKIRIKKKGEIDKASRNNTITIIHGEAITKLHPELKKLAVNSVLIIPLAYRNQSIGVLLLFSAANEDLSDKELHALKLFGSMASLAISKMTMHEETKRAVEIRDRFIALASHELRTPLTSLNGYIQLLYGKLAGKDSSESRWVEELYRESVRLTNLVKDLLDINRIKQGQYAFVLSEVNIKEVIKKAIERSQYTHPDTIINYEDNITDEAYIIIGDSQKLLEMFSALLTNAIKFSKPRSEIFLTLSLKSRTVHVRVKDHGKGIPREDLEHIFDGFYKTKHSKDKEGMGVGLLLAKHIVKLHRGKMNIISKEHKGTTVDVILPGANM